MRQRGIREVTEIRAVNGLWGRATEQRVLSEALDAAKGGGQGSAVVVVGEPGMGKSTLLAHAVEAAAARGIPSEAACGHPETSDWPFAVVRSLLEQLEGTSRSAAGTGGAGSVPAATGFGLAEDALDRLVTATVEPIVLAVDDVQWVDAGSLDVLVSLVRRIGAQSAVVLLALRTSATDEDGRDTCARLVAAGARRLPLTGLSDEDVGAMASARLGAGNAGHAMPALRQAGGHPFYTDLLLEHLASVAVAPEGVPVVAEHDPAAAVRGAVIDSLSRLGLAKDELLQVGSVIGASFSARALATAVGRDVVEVWRGLEPAVAAGLLQVEGAELGFRHDLVRAAVYDDMPAPLRDHWHRHVAEVLARDGVNAAVVAAHLSQVADRHDPWALAWLRRAAREASGLAPATAAGLLRRALRFCGDDAAARHEVTGELALCLVWAGRITEAEQLLAAGSGLRSPVTRGRLLFAIAWARWVTGRNEEAAQVAVSGSRDPDLSAEDRDRLTGLAAWVVGFQLGRLEEALGLAEAVRGSSQLFARLMGQATSIAVDYLRGRPVEAASRARELADQVRVSADPEATQVGADILCALAAIDADLLPVADSAIAHGSSGPGLSETASVAGVWHRTRALRHFALGDWDDALAELDALRDLASETGQQLGLVAGEAMRVMIATHRGDLVEARSSVTAAASGNVEYRAHWLLWSAALVHEADGDPSAAVQQAASLWATCRSKGLLIDLPWVGPDVVRLSLAAGEKALADEVVQALEPLGASGPASAAGALRWCRGLVASDPDELLAAADLFRVAQRRHAQGLTTLQAASALALRGDAAAAAAHAADALEQLTPLGAAPAMQLATTLASPAVRPRARRPRAAFGWESLTPTERRVARLCADGLSNPEIAAELWVSRRTVESHMARVLMKLQVRSRVQVVRVVLGQD